MRHNALRESVVAFILLLLLVIIVNPLHLWMPSMMHYSVLVGAVVVFGLFAALVLGENAGDEREAEHRRNAGRTAYLAGSLVLICGIVYQSTMHIVDVWLVSALVVMTLAKVATRSYAEHVR